MFHGHNTSGRASARYPASWFLLSDDPGGGGRVRNGCEFTLCPVDFTAQLITSDVGNDFVVDAEFGAGVRRRSVDIDLTGVGQDGGGAVAVEVVADDA